MAEDFETILWLLLVGFVWGSTNPFIKRGSEIAEKRRLEDVQGSHSQHSKARGFVGRLVGFWQDLLSTWQYVVPFLINLSGSPLFVLTLAHANISVAVPVANAATFLFTALAGWLLGEKLEPIRTCVGMALVVAGIGLCVSA